MNNEQNVVIAVDIGTTSVKTLVIDVAGQVKGVHSIGYPLDVPQADMAEQDPEHIFQAVVDGIQAVILSTGVEKDDILCVSFSSAMHSLIVMDEHHRPLTPSIIWADQRSVDAAEELITSGIGQSIYQSTGTPIHPMSPLTKLIWLQKNRPEIYKQASKFIGIKEYIFYRLFNEYTIDYSIASATGMFNIHQLAWDAQALQVTGVELHQLSEPVPTTHIIKGMVPEYASMIGINEGTPFVIGASDGVLANLGIGVMDSSEVAVTIGTSSAVRAVVRKPTLDPEGRLFCYALAEDYWIIGGASNNGGVALRWTVEQLFSDGAAPLSHQQLEQYTSFLEIAKQAPAGSNGLLFLPLLTGERAPFWDAKARGVYFGLSISHHKAHMLRAAMEGIIFQIGSIVSLMEGLSVTPSLIRASGGVLRSEIICQMMADVLGIPVEIPEVIESSGLGAAKLGLYAMGMIDSLVDSSSSSKNSSQVRFEPNEQNHQIYQQLLPLYQQVYNQLKDSFKQIAKFQVSDSSNIKEMTT
ncbi:gluconokinase [Paenibacillus crassostreae]|uniref:Gluconokinase n=1 Tax=Paenibacillus crassostreae TaxID=1763538 RepID=A0A167FSX0_9BACL|nr:gluconokinase [Paenibacillus crassostreae]AOZ94095.1 gluconate kinase [Paenibacillus crassostreae]OAB76869.1 gluconokinase [Paenibacillus crassostreae]